MKGFVATFTVQVAAWEDVVKRVNSLGGSWTAEVPARFKSVNDVVPLLGAFLPGDPQYDEPAVKEISVRAEDIPSSFDSAQQWKHCTVIANVRDQSSCGTCWAFGSVESFESRACIATGKDIKYSPEDTGFCSDAGYGCDGGNSAWNWFRSNGVVTGGDYTDRDTGDSCLPYSLKPCAHHVPGSEKYEPCPSSEYPSPSCESACSDGGYSKSYNSDKVKAKSAYSVRGVQQIQQEIMTNGPLYVAFTVYDDFPTYKSGVYHATSSSMLGGHAVLAVGWGTLNGEDYWKIKNSWNEEWGDNGHFLIRRGTNECGIESSVSGGLVDATPTPTPSPTPQPSPLPPAPTPEPTPAPSPSKVHYGAPPCNEDEEVLATTDGASVCAPHCSGGASSCPTDTPGGHGGLFGNPTCGSGSFSDYCVITCFDDDDCATNLGFSCHDADGGLGVCAAAKSKDVIV